jgi:lipopolysaccharide/colanic/teichoic acid biosynthesis glycosyltransferase
MVVDAEKNVGAVLATENDQRITKTGLIMRSARIDEIPQFFNVLAGSMSLVGPRPERPVFVKEYNKKYPQYRYRLSVKPGITGLAQVKGSYTTTPENKLKSDLMYIINYSVLLDIKILFQTVKVVLNKEQAKGYLEKDYAKLLSATDAYISEGDGRSRQIIKIYESQ